MAANPKKVLEAFDPGQIRVGNVVLAPVTLGHLKTLEIIKSPFVQPDKKLRIITTDSIIEIVFILTRPAPETRDLLSAGRPVFFKAAYDFASTIPCQHLKALGDAIGAHLAQAFSSIIGPAGSGAQKKTATAPGTPSSTKSEAASAGS